MSDKQSVGAGRSGWRILKRNASLGSLSHPGIPGRQLRLAYGNSHDVPGGSSRCHFNGFILTSQLLSMISLQAHIPSYSLPPPYHTTDRILLTSKDPYTFLRLLNDSFAQACTTSRVLYNFHNISIHPPYNDAVLPTKGSITYPYLGHQSTATSRYPITYSTFSPAVLSIDMPCVSKEGCAGQRQHEHRGNGV